jgi:hypothetical protein
MVGLNLHRAASTLARNCRPWQKQLQAVEENEDEDVRLEVEEDDEEEEEEDSEEDVDYSEKVEWVISPSVQTSRRQNLR